MTFYTGGAPTLSRRTMLDIPADSSEVWDASFGGSRETSPTASYARMQGLEHATVGRPQVGAGLGRLPSQRLEPETPMLDAKAARDQIAEMGLEIKVPEQGIRQGALDILVGRHREQAARQQVLMRAGGGSMGTQIAASFAAALMDPLNIASAFVPVVGPARYAGMLANATGPLAKAGVRAGVGAAEGAVGAAIIEPLPLLAAHRDQTEYGLSDSFANIAFGGVLGGGLHTVGGAASDALRRRMAVETPQVETVLNATGRQAPQPTQPAPTLSAADFDRVFDQDPETALRASLARQLDEDSATLQLNERQAIEEIKPTLTGERIGNVADLRVERLSLTQQAMNLDDTFRDSAKEFQGQGMSRKEAERAARESIAVQREQIGIRQAEINTMLERNQAGEFERRDLGLIERGEVPERLRPQIEARTKQIMSGYQRHPLGASVRTAREVAESADWKVRDHALRTAVAQSVSGRDIDVQALFDLESFSKANSAIEYVKRPTPPRADPEGQAMSRGVDSEAGMRELNELDAARQAYEEDKALTDEMLDQLSEQERADVLASVREETDAAKARADRAEQYSKAYRAAAVCDIRSGN